MPNKRRRVRGYITLRLSPSRDADLIQWWEQVPDGEGAELVKRAIREYLKGSANEGRAATVADLERMALWLVGEMRALNLTPPTPSPLRREGEAEGERLTDEEVQQRERAVRARKW